MDEPKMNDSGERRTFSTGAVRDRGGFKPRPDLISPHANLREGAWMAKGTEKYGTRNYEKGIPISECIASLNRHLEAYKLGQIDEDHMAAVRTNASFILHFEGEIKAGRLDPSIDDMPHYATPEPGDTRINPKTAGGKEILGDLSVGSRDLNCNDINEDACEARSGCVGCPASDHTGTIYVAGPMRGYEQSNFPAFDAARDRFKVWGYVVISPADLDRDAGFDPTEPRPVAELEKLGTVILRDVQAIIGRLQPSSSKCKDAIALLPGWKNSKGAAVEVALGKFLGLTFVNAETGQYMEV